MGFKAHEEARSVKVERFGILVILMSKWLSLIVKQRAGRLHGERNEIAVEVIGESTLRPVPALDSRKSAAVERNPQAGPAEKLPVGPSYVNCTLKAKRS